MKNWEAAAGFVENALAYGKDEELSHKMRVEILMANLANIRRLLDIEGGDRECLRYDEDDFR